MAEWTLRRATAGDADGLGRCFDAAYEPYAERIADLPPMSENCAEEIAEHVVWVAEAEGAIVGGLIIGIGEKVFEIYWGGLIGGGTEGWFAYIIALIFLLFRPQGLFGDKIIERV